MAALPNFLTSKGLTGDPGLPEILSPAAPQSMPDVAMPPGVSAPAPAPPPSHGFAQALTAALPIILATIARTRGGPLAGAAALEGYATAQQHQRTSDEAQRRYDAATALSEQDRQAKADAAESKRQADLQSFIEHQAAILRDPKNGLVQDPTRWAATVAAADATARKVFGSAPGVVASHPSLQFSDASASKQAQSEAQALLDTAQKQVGPEQWAEMVKSPDAYAIGGKSLKDLLAASSVAVTKGDQGVPPAPAKPPTENEAAMIQTEVAIAQKKKGAPLTDEELQQARERGRQRWATGGQAQAIGDMNVSPRALQFVSEMALSGVNVQNVVPSFSGRAGAQAKASFIEDLATRAGTLGLSGHDLAAIMTDSKAKQAAYANAQKLGTQTLINEANARKNFAQLEELARKADASVLTTSSTLLNNWIRTGVMDFSGQSDDVRNFANILANTMTEYAKVVSGATTGAGVTEAANAQAQRLLSKGLTAGSIASFRAQAEREMQNRTSSYDEALKGIFGNIRESGTTNAATGGLGSGAMPPGSSTAAVPSDITAYFAGKSIGARVSVKETGETWELTKTGPVLVVKK